MKWVFVFFALFTACASQTVGEKVSGVDFWQGKFSFSRKNESTRTVQAFLVSDPVHRKMRIDLKVFLGLTVATYLRKSKEAHFWEFGKKYYLRSTSPKRIFENLSGIKGFNPDDLFTFLTSMKSGFGLWSCRVEKKVYKCESPEGFGAVIDQSQSNVRKIKIFKGGQKVNLHVRRVGGKVTDKTFKVIQVKDFLENRI